MSRGNVVADYRHSRPKSQTSDSGREAVMSRGNVVADYRHSRPKSQTSDSGW